LIYGWPKRLRGLQPTSSGTRSSTSRTSGDQRLAWPGETRISPRSRGCGNAGYKQTLLIDSGGCGQNAADLLQYAQAVFDSDPQKNVVFSLHIYGGFYRPATASWQQDYDTLLAQMSLLNVPIVIGEFGPGRNIGPSPTPITPLEIMTTAEGYKWGWMAWRLTTAIRHLFAMLYNNSVYNTSADLTIFGKVAVDNPIYGLKAIAVKAVALTGTPPLP